MDRINLTEIANEYGAINLRFFIPMRPTHSLHGVLGIPMGYTSSDDDEVTVECFVDEDQYRVADGYKIRLRATNGPFTHETYYQRDFEKMHSAYPDLFSIYVLVDEDNKYHRIA